MFIKVVKISFKVFAVIVSIMLIISGLLLVYKDDIKKLAIDEANEYLNKKVHVGYVEIGIWKTFPNLTLDFENVLIHSKFDTLQTIDTAFFVAQLSLRLNPLDFFKGNYTVHEIELNDGLINMVTQEDGNINYDLLKSEDSNTNNTDFSFSLKQITLENIHFNYINHFTKQDYGTLINNMALQGDFSSGHSILTANSDLFINHITNKSLPLIQRKPAVLSVSIEMDYLNSDFQIKNTTVSLSKIPIEINGGIKKDSIQFVISGENIELTDFVNNFSATELNVVHELDGQGVFGINISIQGTTESTSSPAIKAEFNIKDGSLKSDDFSVSKINLNGHYNNGINSKEELIFQNLSFVSQGNHFKGNLQITEFERPRLIGKANGQLNLAFVNQIFNQSTPFTKLSGLVDLSGKFNIKFQNPTYDPFNLIVSDARANFILKSIEAQLKDDSKMIQIPSGEVVVRNQNAGLNKVNMSYGNSILTFNGTINQFVNYLKNEGELLVDASIESDNIDLDELFYSSSEENTRYWLLPTSIKGQLALNIKNLKYSGHLAENIKTSIKFGNRKLEFPYLKLTNAQADIQGNLTIIERLPMLIDISTKLISDNIQIAKLFTEWNNFDQTVILADNISGLASVKLQFTGPFNLYENIDLKEQFESSIQLKIQNGALKNVSTFKEITESVRNSSAKLLLSKKHINSIEKELENLKFKTFENQILLQNGVLEIPEMHLKSNVLDMNVTGTHSFENKIDYDFDFRFRELKDNSSGNEFGEIMDDGTGIRIFLRMFGDLYDPSFEWNMDKQKQKIKEDINQAKNDLKSTLKQGFGINGKDTSITTLPTENKLDEKLFLDFNPSDSTDILEIETKEKKKNKWGKLVDQWKEENKIENEEFEIDE